MDRKLAALITAGVLILGGALIFRSQVQSLLSFGRSAAPSSLPAAPSGAASAPSVTITPLPALPAYTGRDPAEVRPVADAVKDLSNLQRAKLYDAIRTTGVALKKNPGDINGWLELGINKKIIGDLEGARDAWEYDSLAAPSNPYSFHNLGELYWHFLHDAAEAEQNFKTSIHNDPHIIDTYLWLSLFYRTSNDPAKRPLAETVLLEGLSANPANRDLTGYLASYYELDAHNIPKAIEYYEKLVALDSTNTAASSALAKLKASQ